MKVWIVKYALTKGIYEVECEKNKFGAMMEKSASLPVFYHGEGKEWCRTKEEAVQAAEKMRQQKITSLEKQIEKLKKMKF